MNYVRYFSSRFNTDASKHRCGLETSGLSSNFKYTYNVQMHLRLDNNTCMYVCLDTHKTDIDGSRGDLFVQYWFGIMGLHRELIVSFQPLNYELINNIF